MSILPTPQLSTATVQVPGNYAFTITNNATTNTVNYPAWNWPAPTVNVPTIDWQQLNQQLATATQQAQVMKNAWNYMKFTAANPVPRTFNKYVNASDLLEEFIAYLGSEGVRSGEIMGLPVELFIKWLVIRACEVDQEEPGIVLELPAPKPQPRCLGCRRWMPRSVPLLLHGEQCARWWFAREAA